MTLLVYSVLTNFCMVMFLVGLIAGMKIRSWDILNRRSSLERVICWLMIFKTFERALWLTKGW